MPFVIKARRTPRITPEALTRAEQALVRMLRNAFRALSRSAGSDQVAHALRTQTANGALDALNWEEFAQTLGALADSYASTMNEAGAAGTVTNWQNLPSKVGFRYRFNASDPRALAWAQSQAAALITHLTEEQRLRLRDIIAEGYGTGLTHNQLAGRLAMEVGLTPNGSQQVRRLEERQYAKYMADGMPSDKAAARAAAEAQRFSERLLRQRTETIARTELLRAQNTGRYLGFQQMVEQGVADAGSMKKYRTAGESLHGAVCPICAPMDGEIVPWNNEFSNGIQFPPAHPNCRCTFTMLPPQNARLAENPRPVDDFTTLPPATLNTPILRA